MNPRKEKVEDLLSVCGAKNIAYASTHTGRLEFFAVNGKVILVQDTGRGVEVYVPITQTNDMADLLSAIREYAKS